MGKKSKNSIKNIVKANKAYIADASSLKIPERCLEEFEKSLATMLESLSSKKIEVLRTYAYNSKSDPTTVIGKISAKYLLEEDENVESLQQKIITAANLDAYVNTKFVTVKSTTSSETSNSSQDTAPKRETETNHNARQSKAKVQQEQEVVFKPRRSVNSGQEKDDSKQSVTPPRRSEVDRCRLKKSSSDDMRRIDYSGLEQNLFADDDANGILPARKGHSGLNKSFSHFRDYRELIEMKPNVYIKSNKHFIIDELSLEDILQRIYFEAYAYEDLKEYVASALSKISSINEFLDILYNSMKDYSTTVREHIMEQLGEVIIKTKRLIKGNNGYPEIVHEFGGYKKFSKHATTYTRIINKIYEAYKSLEMTSVEIEKVSTLYIRDFCKEKFKFSCDDFQKRVFIKYFYGDPWIKDFLEIITKYLEEKHFYASKYPTAVLQIIELNEINNQLQQYYPDGDSEYVDEKEYDQQCGLEEDDDIQEADNERVRVSLTVQEELFKKMIQRDWIEAGVDDDEDRADDYVQPSGTKTKKKKKKNKKNKVDANKEAGQVQSPPDNGSKKEGVIEQVSSNEGKKKDYLRLLKQNTGNVKLDNEVEAFERRLDSEVDQTLNKQEKIKPNISEEWVQSLRHRLHKTNNLF